MNEVVHTSPTIGSNVEEIVVKNTHFLMWDIGGQESLRSSWNTYYSNTEVSLFLLLFFIFLLFLMHILHFSPVQECCSAAVFLLIVAAGVFASQTATEAAQVRVQPFNKEDCLRIKARVSCHNTLETQGKREEQKEADVCENFKQYSPLSHINVTESCTWYGTFNRC